MSWAFWFGPALPGGHPTVLTPTQFGFHSPFPAKTGREALKLMTAAVLATTQPIWAAQPPAAIAQVSTPSNLPWDTDFSLPPPLPRGMAQQAYLDNAYAWNPQAQTPQAASYGFQNETTVYSPAKRSVALLSSVAWTPQFIQVAPFDFFHQQWIDVPKAARRATELLGSTAIWPAQVAQVQYQDGWRSEFSKPYRLSPQPRLEGNVAWPGAGYLFTQVQTTATIEWWGRFEDPPGYLKTRPRLEGYTAWAARTADTEYQDGWRSEFSKPYRLAPQPRLEGSIAWPGIGYSFTQTQTPASLMWWFRWGEPTPAPKRATELYGNSNMWAAKVATVEYQEGWRSRFQEPPAYSKPKPRLEGSIAWAAQIARSEYQDGWRAAFSTPPSYLRARVNRPLGWLSYVTTFDTQAATPSIWWRAQWVDPPRRKPANVRLLDSYSIDWIFHGGTTTPAAPVIKSFILYLDDSNVVLPVEALATITVYVDEATIGVQSVEPIRLNVEAVNFNLVVSSMTPDPDLDP